MVEDDGSNENLYLPDKESDTILWKGTPLLKSLKIVNVKGPHCIFSMLVASFSDNSPFAHHIFYTGRVVKEYSHIWTSSRLFGRDFY